MGHYKSNHKISSKRQHSNNIKLFSSVKSWNAFSANSVAFMINLYQPIINLFDETSSSE